MSHIVTQSGARIICKTVAPQHSINYLLLPGGPGLGSESLNELSTLLNDNIQANIWHVDLPGDGSNRGNNKHFSNWQQALIEAASELDNTVLVGHSTGGMYIQDTPELENLIIGLVLMDTAPNCQWKKSFEAYCISNPLPEISTYMAQFEKNPTDELLKEITALSAQYCFMPNFVEMGKQLIRNLPINYETCLYSELNFDNTYQSKWIPQQIPTLIFAGQYDKITPISLYTNEKAYQRNNILINQIPNAAHFPWFENPDKVLELFVFHRKQILI